MDGEKGTKQGRALIWNALMVLFAAILGSATSGLFLIWSQSLSTENRATTSSAEKHYELALNMVKAYDDYLTKMQVAWRALVLRDSAGTSDRSSWNEWALMRCAEAYESSDSVLLLCSTDAILPVMQCNVALAKWFACPKDIPPKELMKNFSANRVALLIVLRSDLQLHMSTALRDEVSSDLASRLQQNALEQMENIKNMGPSSPPSTSRLEAKP